MNTFGRLFRLTTFGESHGAAIGGIIDGFPAGLELDISAIHKALDRRKPGQSVITTSRKESDFLEILSGVFEGKTIGTPIAFIILNKDQKSSNQIVSDLVKSCFRKIVKNSIQKRPEIEVHLIRS